MLNPNRSHQNTRIDGKLFLRALGKKRDHAMMYERVSGDNLALMRERHIWPTDDTNTEKIGS
uniref:Uncharacterized protein n=1 Tax=Leersia perrieri TaxID=77586 RepID=A0A0D9W0G0_9ORYZ